MATPTPMDVLRDLAEKRLHDTTTRLGMARQTHAQATVRLEQLQNYEHEYRQQLQKAIEGKGVPVIELLTRQSFIDSLNNVVNQQTRHVTHCQFSVDNVLSTWKKEKQRLSAFETLKSRAEAVKQLKETRQEQKLMDEFARRASQKRE
ncbi:flagella biosynthesis chaperone FliJ [Enterobacter pasteurii]|uniref:flagellar export protein FliJ n=1 Tax=Enterobacter pasteurii TaxID=3029761 RepID=UPI0011DD9487|nr:flagellar export protein FliJ [Enterobacter pasteurii]QLA68082.1 flagella biosynthesis chaperone FliJ [Enterobacter pasteurii]